MSSLTFQIRRDPTKKKVSGIPTRIEELGKLNDEFVRLMALLTLDVNGLVKLARKYEARGMKAMAKGVLREAGCDII